MDITWIQAHCKTLAGTTETIQWVDDLVFKVGGKMYAVVVLNDKYETKMSFKCSPEEFAELIEMEGCKPAPYLARAHWVALERMDALPRTEIKKRLTRAYELVKEKLSKKAQGELAAQASASSAAQASASSEAKARARSKANLP